MFKFLGCVLLLLAGVAAADGNGKQSRVLPTNENCDPQNQVCRKGDWTSTYIADCERRDFLTCNVQNDVSYSWTVDLAEDDKCKPVTGLQFICGQAGTNTRCVCSDTKLPFNECRCQYWPTEDPGVSFPAFCTGYYVGGVTGIHHWACCNNCGDDLTTNTCDGVTWQGGSSQSYCAACGQNTGGGRVKYYFNCGSCSKQQECEETCNGLNIPLLCWRWLDCFKGCCLEKAQQPSKDKRQISTVPFCGDGTCDGAGESPTTCPTDCCYQVNSACAKDNSCNIICDLECCGSPSCCLENNAASVIAGIYSRVILAVFVVLSFI